MLATAHDLIRGGQPDDEPLRPGELATALIWRISMLTDPPTAAPEDDPPPPGDIPAAQRRPPGLSYSSTQTSSSTKTGWPAWSNPTKNLPCVASRSARGARRRRD